MVILEPLKELFNSGDPLLRSWTLVHSPWAPFICTALYMFFVKRLGPDLMRNRQPFELRNLMIFYNFSVVFGYVICLCALVYNFLFNGAYKGLCIPTPVVENHYSYWCASVGWYIYILKYVEFADTVFFVLRKKNHLITNLHLIHHSSLPVICWMMMRIERSGFQFIPAGINSFVHVIMYTYYGLAAMGPEVQKRLWWKEHLTKLQMAQFVVILLFMFLIVPLSGCKTTNSGVYLVAFFATTFLALFYNFYNKTYNSTRTGRASKISNDVNGENKNSELKQNGVSKDDELKQNGVHKNGDYMHNTKSFKED